MTRNHLLLAMIVLSVASKAFPQNAPTNNPSPSVQSTDALLLQTKLEPMIQKTLLENEIPGFAIGVVKNGKLVYAKGFGVMRLGSDKPVTPASLFHMASVTKTFVATAIMQLVEQGKMNLDEPLTKYLSYFRMKDERYKAITIRQMLSHTSGMPDVTNYNWDKPEYDDKALERFVQSLSNLSLIGESGQKFRYSNMAFEILGDVIAKVSGESFEDYVQHHILTSLGMRHSTLLVKEADAQLLTTPHVKENGKVVVSKIFPYHRAHAPSSTLYSSIEDMSRYAMANLNRGELNGKRILKASTYDEIWKPVANTGSSSISKVGISWFLHEVKGHRTVMHSGGDTGFNSFLILAPDDSVGVVAMSNYSPNSKCLVCDLSGAAFQLMLGYELSPSAGKETFPTIDTTILSKVSTEQVLEKYVAALGGKETLQKVTGRVSKGTFEVVGVGLAGTATIYEKSQNKQALVLDVPGQATYSRGFDGTVAWENDPDNGVHELQGAELARAKRDADFYQSLHLRDLYPKINLKGQTKLNNIDTYLLEAPRNGNPKWWYFDIRTGLLLRLEDRDAKGNIVRAEDYEDYKSVDGIKLPFTLTLTEEEKILIKLNEVKHDVAIDEANFSKPKK